MSVLEHQSLSSSEKSDILPHDFHGRGAGEVIRGDVSEGIDQPLGDSNAEDESDFTRGISLANRIDLNPALMKLPTLRTFELETAR